MIEGRQRVTSRLEVHDLEEVEVCFLLTSTFLARVLVGREAVEMRNW